MTCCAATYCNYSICYGLGSFSTVYMNTLGQHACTRVHSQHPVPGKVSGRSLPLPGGHILWRATDGRKTHDQQTKVTLVLLFRGSRQHNTNLQMLQVVLLYVLGEIVHLRRRKTNMRRKYWHFKRKKSIFFIRQEVLWSVTCTELVMVLRANTVAQSFMVDWLSNAPWVSTSSTATCWDERGQI